MDAIYGVTRELLAELHCKYGELKAKLGERAAQGEFELYLRNKGLDMNSYACAHNGWWERFRADPTGRAEAEFHMLEQELARRAHFGDVRDMSADTEEGITLDQYAQITVAVSRQGADAAAIVARFGLRDVAHWQRANGAWTKKMGADTTHKLTMQFGQLYQNYAGPSFREELVAQTAAIVADANKPKDVVREPEEALTPDLCVRKLQSPSRAERWRYAGYYANMADLNNVPDKALAIATLTPVLLEMIEHHDEHTTSDAEKGIRQLWDLGVRTEDVRGAAARCLNRAKDKLASLQAAFAPIRDTAVPERVTLQSRIQDHTSLVETMQEYLERSWGATPPAPAATVATPAARVAPGPGGHFPRWVAAPVVLAVLASSAFVMRSRAAHADNPDTAASAPAATPAADTPATETAPAAAATPPAAAAAKDPVVARTASGKTVKPAKKKAGK